VLSGLSCCFLLLVLHAWGLSLGCMVLLLSLMPSYLKQKKIALFTSPGVVTIGVLTYIFDGYVLWQIGRTSCNLDFFFFIYIVLDKKVIKTLKI
jgi:hypothetical protein